MQVAATGDDHADAVLGIDRLRVFFRSLGLPVTMKELGVDNPDIDLLVNKLHENKGETLGGYMTLSRKETTEIYRLMC